MISAATTIAATQTRANARRPPPGKRSEGYDREAERIERHMRCLDCIAPSEQLGVL